MGRQELQQGEQWLYKWVSSPLKWRGSFLHASERNNLSFRNIDIYPKKSMQPLNMAMATVKVDISPGITSTDIDMCYWKWSNGKWKEERERERMRAENREIYTHTYKHAALIEIFSLSKCKF